jgi:hypothetical protein
VCPFISKSNTKKTRYVENFADHIIPLGGPSYAKSYHHHPKCREIVPFAIDIHFIPERKNNLNGKIKILHGISRSGFKGTDVILEALNQAQLEYPELFKIIIPEKLPFNDYLKLLSTANVVFDQLYGDGLGMNALYSMGSSCVVFTCFDRIKIGKLDLTDAPAIQIGATVEEIYQQIISLKTWAKENFITTGERSRQFVLDHYSPVKVAQQVMDHWTSTRDTSLLATK